MFTREAIISRASLVLLCTAVLGCGAQDTGVYNLAGNVTFDGKPVSSGRIMIVPDGAQGNTGAAGVAEIKDGKFDTSVEGGKGCVSGPVIIRIEGFEDSGQTETDPENPEVQISVVTPLFATFEMKQTLPEEDSTLDLNVPAEAADRKDLPENPSTRGGVDV